MRFFSRKNYTLIEILCAIAIIGILAGMILGTVAISSRKSSETKTAAMLEMIRQAMTNYKQKYGYYPHKGSDGNFIVFKLDKYEDAATEDELKVENNLNQYLDLEYFKQSGEISKSGNEITITPLDGFDRVFFYCCPGKFNTSSYDLVTMGPDGKIGFSSTTPKADASKITEALIKSDLGKGDDIANFKR